MADGKNIEIKIAATGGDQAAGEIKKVGDASQETGKKVAAMEDQTERSKSEDRMARLKGVAAATGAIGIAAGLAKQTLSNVWEQLDKIDTVELRKLDSAWADQIENAKKFRDALEDPIGALAALANGGTTIKEAFADLDEQMKLNAEASQAQIDRVIKKAGVNVEEIKKLAADIKTANELLSAKDELAAVQREGQAAEAIRNGADEDDVAAELAKAAAADKIRAIERRQEQVRKEEDPQAYYDAAKRSRALAEDPQPELDRRIAEAEADYKKKSDEFEKINPWRNPQDASRALDARDKAQEAKDTIYSNDTRRQISEQASKQAEEMQNAYEAAKKRVADVDAKAEI